MYELDIRSVRCKISYTNNNISRNARFSSITSYAANRMTRSTTGLRHDVTRDQSHDAKHHGPSDIGDDEEEPARFIQPARFMRDLDCFVGGESRAFLDGANAGRQRAERARVGHGGVE